MLKHRVITAIILIPIFVALVLKLSSTAFCSLTAAITLWGAYEWSGFLGAQKRLTRIIFPVVVLVSMLGIFLLPMIPILYAAAVWWIAALLLVLVYPRLSTLWGKSILVRSLMGLLVLLPCWVALNFIRNMQHGTALVLFLFVLIWGADIGAYFTGKKWGKHKLASRVSPGKTWQGLMGALITSLLIAAGVFLKLQIPYAIWSIALGWVALTIFVSILGDLFESMLKRNVGLKDSGTLLPGHGGILDRIDSLTAAAPIFALGLLSIGKII